MDGKIVAFAGHRYEWHCIGVEEKLLQTLEDLIRKGYTSFMMDITVRLIESVWTLF